MACLLLLPSYATPLLYAADIGFRCHKFEDLELCDYAIVGEIKPGDYGRFLSLLRLGRAEIDFVQLDSPGGDLREAIRIAELIRNASLFTTVVSEVSDETSRPHVSYGKCASAYFIIWVGGVYRDDGMLLSRSALSPFYLHRPYFYPDKYASYEPKRLADETARLTASVREYLSNNGVPQHIIDRMMKHSSAEAYRLTKEEAKEISGFAAWYEEWLLARCGPHPFPKTDRPATRSRKEEIDRSLWEMEQPKWKAWKECRDKAQYEARENFLLSLR